MAALNRVQLIGHLGSDPEARFTSSGRQLATFRVAVTKRWKKDEAWQEATEWITIEAWGPLAERCAQSLRKGSLVYIEGELRTNRYEDKSGETKYFTNVRPDPETLDRKQAAEPVLAVEEEQAAYAA
jgi:single-strand DNA-binding protein